MISDADGSARNDKLSLSMAKSSTNVLSGKMPIVQMYYPVKMRIIINKAAGKSGREPDTQPAGP